jgi:hypothetical protein
MARKPRSQQREIQAAPAPAVLELGGGLEDEAPFLDHEADAIARITGDLEGDSSAQFLIRVCRVVERLGQRPREPWMFDVTTAELNDLRPRLQRMGGGHFRCKVSKNGRPLKLYDLHIEPPEGPLHAPLSPLGAPPVQAPAPDPNRELQERLFTVLLDRALAGPPAPPPPAPGPNILEMLTQGIAMFKAIQGIMPQAAAPDIGLKMFREGFDLAKELGAGGGGSGEGGGGLMGVLKTVLETPGLGEALRGAIAAATGQAQPGAPAPAIAGPRHVLDRTHLVQPAPAPLAAPVPIAPAPAAPIAPAAAPLTPEQQQQAAALKAVGEAVNYLLAQAQAGVQPETLADWVLDTMPPALITYLEQQEAAPVDTLAQFMPQIAPYRAWFARLLDSCFDAAGGAGITAPAAGADLATGRAN